MCQDGDDKEHILLRPSFLHLLPLFFYSLFSSCSHPHHDNRYWILFIIMRKFLIVTAALCFRSNPTFQMIFILLVLFAAHHFQVKYRPYMSNAEKADVIEQNKHLLPGNFDLKTLTFEDEKEAANKSKEYRSAVKLGSLDYLQTKEGRMKAISDGGELNGHSRGSFDNDGCARSIPSTTSPNVCMSKG